ncbi:MAG: SUMF1/EgtB/PvdO family nonheme iron enzyme, partial [Planctomycetota bacterium]
TPEGRALLLDFGLARDVTSGSLTATFAGTPHYAAPEQLSGAALDARADVYALGATLYQCLTGRVPFPGRTLDQVIRRALLEDPLPPRRLDPALPRDVDVVVLKALAKAAARDREALFHGTLDLLRTAEHADPDVAGTEEVRALLYAERWKEAHANRDPAAESFYREQVLAHDPTGRIAREMEDLCSITITSAVPAEVYLFRCLEEAEIVKGGERRLVPVGHPQAAEGVVPGTWALRVALPAGGIEATDVILRVEGHPVEGTVLVTEPLRDVQRLDRLVAIGGTQVRCLLDVREYGGEGDDREFEFEREGRRFAVRARSLAEIATVTDAQGVAEMGGARGTVFRMGTVQEMDLPAGLKVRTTAAPLLPHAGCLAGTTPLTVVVPPGSCIVLALVPGRPPVRRDFYPPAGAKLACDLTPPAAPAPPDFVYVPDPSDPKSCFWILDREVTSAEYVGFLNDADGADTRVPRGPEGKPFWQRGADGRFVPTRADVPVYGVSFDDARAYAEWLTLRARAGGERRRFALPTFREWRLAGGERQYVFGDQFRAKWMNSCFARPKPLIRPGRSFPVDESPVGAFDMAGNMWEWLDHWYGDGNRSRQVGG